MTSARTLIPILLALLTTAAALDAQRPRFRRFRRPRPEPQATAPEPSQKAEVEKWLAVRGGDVYTGTGRLLRRATVLIGDAKIHGVGHDLDLPEGTGVLDATGMVVAPGFVAVKASGMGAPASAGGFRRRRGGSRSSSDGSVRDAVNPFDPSIKMGLAAGITSFLAILDEGSTAPGGKTAVLKLAPGDLDGMVVAEDTVFSMRVPLSPKDWRSFRELVEKAKKRDDEKKETREQGGDEPRRRGRRSRRRRSDRGVEALAKVMKGEARLWVSCRSTYGTEEIRQALAIAREIGRGVVLDAPVTAWTIPDEVAATGSMAILVPRDRTRPDPGNPDATGSNLASAAILAEAGVATAVLPGGGRFSRGTPRLGTNGILGSDLHTLPLDAAFAVRGGLDERKALRTITLDAARIIGADARVGSLEAGKDADLLILDGDPLHYKTFVHTAIVNGKVAYQKDKEPFYRHIER